MDIDTAKKSIAKYSEKTIKTAEKLYQKYYPFNEVIKIAIEKNEDLDVLKYLIEEKSCPVCPVDANRSRERISSEPRAWDILVLAAENGRIDILQWLLEDYKYYANASEFNDNDRYSVLFEAMQNCDFAMIDWILTKSNRESFWNDAASIIKGHIWTQDENKYFIIVLAHYLKEFLQTKSLNEILDRGIYLYNFFPGWGKNGITKEMFRIAYIKLLQQALEFSLENPDITEIILASFTKTDAQAAFDSYTFVLQKLEHYGLLQSYLEKIINDNEMQIFHEPAKALQAKLILEGKIQIEPITLNMTPPGSPLQSVSHFSHSRHNVASKQTLGIDDSPRLT